MPGQHAKRLNQRHEMRGPILTPGVYDALSAALVEKAGFDAAYLSGASIAYTKLGRPDIGLVSAAEVADTIVYSGRQFDIPNIALFNYSTPRVATDALAKPLRNAGPDVRLIGDCFAPRYLQNATAEGRAVGNAI